MSEVLNAAKSKPLLGGPSFTFKNRVARALWTIVWRLVAAWTPAPLHRWRVLVLRAFGADIASTARVYGSAVIWHPANLTMKGYSTLGPRVICYSMDKVVLNEFSVVSQGAHLCCGSHDIGSPDFQLITAPITVGANAWVAAEAFIGPGVTVERGAVVGARAVLFRDAIAHGIYIGNPANLVRRRVVDFEHSASDEN